MTTSSYPPLAPMLQVEAWRLYLDNGIGACLYRTHCHAFKKQWTTKEVNPIKAFLLGCQDYSKTFYFSLTWGPHSAHAFQQRSHATKVHKAIGGKHPNMILRSPHPLKAISNRKMSHRLGKPKLKKVASKQKCCTSKTCCTLLANKFQIFPLQNTTEVIPG